jgi:hypothetical protein
MLCHVIPPWAIASVSPRWDLRTEAERDVWRGSSQGMFRYGELCVAPPMSELATKARFLTTSEV